MFLDERDVHQGSVGVDELEHEGLRDQIVFVLRVRAVILLIRACVCASRADGVNERKALGRMDIRSTLLDNTAWWFFPLLQNNPTRDHTIQGACVFENDSRQFLTRKCST